MTEPSKAAPATSSRIAARSLLSAVLIQGRPLDQSWRRALAPKGWLHGLEPRDRAFARLLTVTVLRRLGEIDAILDRCLERAPPMHVRNVLRLGVAQLHFIGTAPHAAVDATVALIGPDRRRRGLVNAILRRVAAAKLPPIDPAAAARLNTPDWLWRSWVDAYGEATASAIACAHLAEPPLDLTLNAGGDDAANLARQWAGALNGVVLPTGSLRLQAAGNVEELPGFAGGAWWVQDAAAALPEKLFGAVKGKRIIDLCAAPGGKTAQLCAGGARVTAVDRDAERLEVIARNLSRLRLDAELIAADASRWRPDAAADGVLLDAPCTATGTLRRHPDIARLKSPEDVASAAKLQDRLLANAWRMLRPGGVLIYCTCSLQSEENEMRVAKLLASGAPLARVPIAANELAVPADAITGVGDLRTLPSHWQNAGGMDGFYACRLKSISG